MSATVTNTTARTFTVAAEPGSRTPQQFDTWIVIADLGDLRGPETGHLLLPHSLDWGPLRRYDLADAALLRSAYATVLREASTGDQLATLINRRLLEANWASLRLLRRLRDGWESAHPSLRKAVLP